jgi:hypothetical protein
VAVPATQTNYRSARLTALAFGLRGLIGPVDSRGLRLCGFRTLAGASPARIGGWKYTAQRGVSCVLFWIMQAVIRSTSGMNALHNRIASGVQASCWSWL